MSNEVFSSPVREVADGEEERHVPREDEEEGLEEDVQQVVDDPALEDDLDGGGGEVAGGLTGDHQLLAHHLNGKKSIGFRKKISCAASFI